MGRGINHLVALAAVSLESQLFPCLPKEPAWRNRRLPKAGSTRSCERQGNRSFGGTLFPLSVLKYKIKFGLV